MAIPWYAQRPAVRWFAGEMERKLARNDHKTHWSHATHEYLIRRLKEELAELEAEYRAGNMHSMASEAVDIANFAMMIADNAINQGK